MKRPGYREAIFWLAANDDTEWAEYPEHHHLGSPSVTGCLVADMFGVDTERVRRDVQREVRKQRGSP